MKLDIELNPFQVYKYSPPAQLARGLRLAAPPALGLQNNFESFLIKLNPFDVNET
jgi:hypothetical protein